LATEGFTRSQILGTTSGLTIVESDVIHKRIHVIQLAAEACDNPWKE